MKQPPMNLKTIRDYHAAYRQLDQQPFIREVKLAVLTSYTNDFILPLLEVDPHWRHPALAVAGRTLLARLEHERRRSIRGSLDFAASACDKLADERAPRKQVSEGAIARATPSS